MAITAYFIKQSKRRNSTLQFAFTGASEFTCTLKAPTSLDRPTFLLSYPITFDFNLAFFDGKFYFVDDVVSVRDGQWEVSCVVDVLATYKTEILASELFVSFADTTKNPWLADTRIPLSRKVTEKDTSLTGQVPFETGFYVLTVTGDTGTDAFVLTRNQISQLLASVNSWYDTSATDIFDGSRLGISYDFTDPAKAIESLSKIMAQSDVVGNAYSNAPQCIRSCIWLPLKPSDFQDATTKRIMLGSYDTGIDAHTISMDPKVFSVDCDIPWKYDDWRRAVGEDVSLFLPFLGTINLPIDAVSSFAKINVDMYIAGIDGSITYYVYASNPLEEILLGVYKCNCACDYAIGINQKASLGEVVQTIISGVSRAVSGLVESSVAPQSVGGAIATVALEGVRTTYEVANINMSHTPTTIGSLGSSGLGNIAFKCYVLSHDFSIDLATDGYEETIGTPVMKTMSLSSLSGYVQCVNAHIEAPAQASELDAIDGYVNSGFFIE